MAKANKDAEMGEGATADARVGRWGGLKAKCALALLLPACGAIAQNVPETTLRNKAATASASTEPPAQTASVPLESAKLPTVPQEITYRGGQLKIAAINATMAELLGNVAALIGVTIDIPAGVNSERMPVVEFGPGPVREILATLLNDSNLDYVIQASNADPNRIQSVLLMPREKRGGATNASDVVARSSRSPFARGAASARPEGAVAPVENVVAEASVDPQPPSVQPEPSTPPPSTQADPSLPPATRSEQSNMLRPGTLSPPQVLTPQTMNQQLQQMYQQRMQMIQQGQTGPATPGSPGKQFE